MLIPEEFFPYEKPIKIIYKCERMYLNKLIVILNLIGSSTLVKINAHHKQQEVYLLAYGHIYLPRTYQRLKSSSTVQLEVIKL